VWLSHKWTSTNLFPDSQPDTGDVRLQAHAWVVDLRLPPNRKADQGPGLSAERWSSAPHTWHDADQFSLVSNFKLKVVTSRLLQCLVNRNLPNQDLGLHPPFDDSSIPGMNTHIRIANEIGTSHAHDEHCAILKSCTDNFNAELKRNRHRDPSDATSAPNGEPRFDFDSVLVATNTAGNLIEPLAQLAEFLAGAAKFHPYISVVVGPFRVCNVQLLRRCAMIYFQNRSLSRWK